MTVERAAFACAAFSAAVCFAFALLDSLRWPLIHDAAIMHYIGWLVIQGKALYADIFDMNLPATHFLHYVLTRAFSDSDLAFRLCDALFLLLLAFFLGRLIWRVDRAAALWSAVAFPLYVLWRGPNDAFQRDAWIALTMVVAGNYAADLLEASPSREANSTDASGADAASASPSSLARRRFFPPGPLGLSAFALALCGFATLIKPTAALLFLAIGSLIALRKPRSLPASILIYSAPIAGLLGWIWSMDALDELFDIQVHYIASLYSRIYGVGLLNARRLFLETEPILAGFAFVALAMTPACLAASRGNRSLRVALLLVWAMVGFGAVHFIAQRRGSLYHFFPLICAVSVLAALGLGRAVGSPSKWVRRLGATLAVLLAAACIARSYASVSVDYRMRSSHPRSEAMAQLLRKHAPADPAVKIFDTVWGAARALLSERKEMTDRFIYDLHFLHHQNQPYIQALIAELHEGLLDPRTRTILVTRQGWGPLGSGFERVDRIPGVAEILLAHFDLVEETAEARIYQRKKPASDLRDESFFGPESAGSMSDSREFHWRERHP